MNDALIVKMNQCLSNLQVAYVKLHNYHWNIQGKQFFEIHKVTEEYYEQFATMYDDVAERILQLGGKPLSSMKEYLENATIKEEAAKDFNAETVAKNVVADFEAIYNDFKEIRSIADEADDPVTIGYAEEQMGHFEKAFWMLKAFTA